MKIVRALVVDDSAANREAITDILESSPYITVAGTAGDGEEAIERVVRLRPDIITLDLEMPRMDGFTFLRWLMKSAPIPVVVISSRSDDRSVLRALEFGAVDFIAKPVNQGEGLKDLKRDLVEKVKFFAGVEMSKVKSSVAIIDSALRETASERHLPPPPPASGRLSIDVVAIGASTGGPPALQAIITRLPRHFPAAVVISQHMPANFTKFFAERLDKLSEVEVKEAEAGDLLEPGRVLVAPGGYHMLFGRTEGGVKAVLRQAGPQDKYVPSVDAMMKSAAANFGARVLGIVLTGMGNDGLSGMGLIKGMGGPTLAESKETAVIYGMPKEVIEAGIADKAVPLGKMASEIIKACS